MVYGREKAWGESDWKRRMGYYLLGELHVPGRLRSWHVIEELRRLGVWNPGPRSLLDAGGGEGAFSYHAARRFPSWKITVADNEPETIARGERIKRGLGLRNVEIRAADLREPLDNGLHDLILCSDVLEHIEEDALVMRNLGAALKPGGYLLLTSPSVPQPRHLPIVAWRERRIGFDPADYGHVRPGYSREGLLRLIGAAGLEVERIRWTFGVFGTLMFDSFFATGDSKPNPAAYAALFPLYLALSALDMRFPIRHGAAILGVGEEAVIRLDFPLSRDERADWAIRPVVSRAVGFLLDEVGTDRLESVILTGSLSRGEASVLAEEASLRLLGDVELVVILRAPFDWPLARRAMLELGGRAGRALAADGAAASIEYAPAGMAYLARRIRPSIFAYDLLHHGKIVWGRPDVLGAIRPFEARDIPREDALLLVMNRIVERLLLDERLARGDLAPGERAYHLTKLMLDLAGLALAFAGRHVSSYAARRASFAALAGENDSLRAILPEPERFDDELERATLAKLHPTEERLAEREIVPRLHRALVWSRALWLWEARALLSRPAADFPDLVETFLRRERARERLKGWVKCYRHPLRPRKALAPLRTARLFFRASPQTLAYAAALLAQESRLRGCSGAAERARSLLPLRLERAGGIEAPLGALWQWLVRNN